MIGVGVSASLGLLSLLIAAFNRLAGRIDRSGADLRSKIDTGHAELHARVNKVKDEYVRRDDLDRHMVRIDGNVNELRREISAAHKDTNDRLDKIMERLTK